MLCIREASLLQGDDVAEAAMKPALLLVAVEQHRRAVMYGADRLVALRHHAGIDRPPFRAVTAEADPDEHRLVLNAEPDTGLGTLEAFGPGKAGGAKSDDATPTCAPGPSPSAC